MTFREKLIQEYPEKADDTWPAGVGGCPCHYGYEDEPATDSRGICLNAISCYACWDREMPEGDWTEVFEKALKEDGMTETKPHILDSGERRQFDTGAVRDIQKGKGLFDLVPLRVAARIFGAPYIQPEGGYVDPVLWCIGRYQDDGDTCWIYTALVFIAERVFPVGNDRQASIANMLLEVAIHYEEGAQKYAPNNWKKGIPVERYIDSGTRHYMKWMRGDKNEPHNRAAAWNLICLAWEADFSPRAIGKCSHD